MRWYVYLLICRTGTRYCGMTRDLRRRLAEHHRGDVKYTRPRRPVKLVWYHVFRTAAQARQMELSMKNGRSRKKTILQMISEFPEAALSPFASGACQG